MTLELRSLYFNGYYKDSCNLSNRELRIGGIWRYRALRSDYYFLSMNMFLRRSFDEFYRG